MHNDRLCGDMTRGMRFAGGCIHGRIPFANVDEKK